MTKIDLITGFLGNGKTTLLKKYLYYLINNGERICVLEFDYGAVNVDMMLLQEFNDKCDLEMVAGGCDYDCHLRRFKTKLIAMGMKHYDRVIIEPSGIFDPTELFDVINEEPLDSWYEIGSIISVVDPNNLDLSNESKRLLVTQLSYSGLIYISKCQTFSSNEIINKVDNLKDIASEFKLVIDDKNIITKNINELTDEDFLKIKSSSYHESGLKLTSSMIDNNYRSIYLLDKCLSLDKVSKISNELFTDKECGNIIRIKGFIKQDNKWYEFNKTNTENSVKEIQNGQDVIIIIGESLDENKINGLFSK